MQAPTGRHVIGGSSEVRRQRSASGLANDPLVGSPLGCTKPGLRRRRVGRCSHQRLLTRFRELARTGSTGAQPSERSTHSASWSEPATRRVRTSSTSHSQKAWSMREASARRPGPHVRAGCTPRGGPLRALRRASHRPRAGRRATPESVEVAGEQEGAGTPRAQVAEQAPSAGRGGSRDCAARESCAAPTRARSRCRAARRGPASPSDPAARCAAPDRAAAAARARRGRAARCPCRCGRWPARGVRTATPLRWPRPARESAPGRRRRPPPLPAAAGRTAPDRHGRPQVRRPIRSRPVMPERSSVRRIVSARHPRSPFRSAAERIGARDRLVAPGRPKISSTGTPTNRLTARHGAGRFGQTAKRRQPSDLRSTLVTLVDRLARLDLTASSKSSSQLAVDP